MDLHEFLGCLMEWCSEGVPDTRQAVDELLFQ